MVGVMDNRAALFAKYEPLANSAARLESGSLFALDQNDFFPPLQATCPIGILQLQLGMRLLPLLTALSTLL